MNRIVRENYPVSKLPEDLRRDFPGQDEVTLIIEAKTPPTANPNGPEPPYGWGGFSRYRHLAKSNFDSTEEVVAHVRALRDEWEERDRELNKFREP